MAKKIEVHLVIRGRIGDAWMDFDERLRVPAGTTLRGLVDHCQARHIPLGDALANSPHLAETLMLNGERTPVEVNADRVLAAGDQIYLLAPLAGG